MTTTPTTSIPNSHSGSRLLRNAQLSNRKHAPFAAECQPESEHLLPLHVATDAARRDLGKKVFKERVIGKTVSAYQLG
jgi:hypothetical protein